MSSILKKRTVLVLNTSYQAVGLKTVRHAIRSLCGSLRKQREPAKALVVDRNFDGKWCWNGTKLPWDQWVNLPVRDFDDAIQTGRGGIRVPLVIISSHYDGMPTYEVPLTRRAVFERDGFRCQYSGRVLPEGELNIDHVIPRHRGGTNDWTNVVTCSREINQRKGSRLNSEANLRLIRQPFAPRRVAACARIRGVHPAHRGFLVAA